MIDDLITHGTREPYRMFTSRAEYRLLLREDNADLRLTSAGRKMGLIDDMRWARFNAKLDGISHESERLRTTFIHPGTAAAESLADRLSSPLLREASLLELLKRPEFSYADVAALKGDAVTDSQVAEQVEISVKYAGYIDRQQEEIDRLHRSEAITIPANFDYCAVKGLSHEVTHKLTQARPTTIGQASRVPGVTPAAISLLLINLKKKNPSQTPEQNESLAG
jgi:tRNA uridine 5-carboxymethylaminomethyl modification enzyme